MAASGVKIGIFIDLVLALLLVLIIVLGTKRGFLRMVRGLITVILLIVIAVFAVVPATSALCENTNLDESLSLKISEKLNDAVKFDEPYTTLYIVTENAGITDSAGKPIIGVVYKDNNGVVHAFDDLLLKNNSVIQKFCLSNLVKPNVEDYVTRTILNDEGEEVTETREIYLIVALSYTISLYIITSIMGLLMFIVGSILVILIYKFLKNLTKRIYLAYYVDKLAGAFFGLVIGAVVIYVIITIMLLMQGLTFMEPINLGVDSSYVTKYLFQFDALYLFLKDYSVFGSIQKAISGLFPGS